MGQAQRSGRAQGLHPGLRGADQDIGHRIPGGGDREGRPGEGAISRQGPPDRSRPAERLQDFRRRRGRRRRLRQGRRERDRKSTRLNSSHVKISYAVFCLKKKKNKDIEIFLLKKKKKKK